MKVEELVVEHAEWIRRKARCFYRNVDDADDLASETIYKCLSRCKCYDPRRDFKPWVHAVMANTYISQYTRRRCVLFTGMNGVDHPSADLTEESVTIKRIFSILRKCGKKTNGVECVVLYAKGYSYDEIADKLMIPVSTVKSRICAGRKMLREAFEE